VARWRRASAAPPDSGHEQLRADFAERPLKSVSGCRRRALGDVCVAEGADVQAIRFGTILAARMLSAAALGAVVLHPSRWGHEQTFNPKTKWSKLSPVHSLTRFACSHITYCPHAAFCLTSVDWRSSTLSSGIRLLHSVIWVILDCERLQVIGAN
jgi:hypothetical protein